MWHVVYFWRKERGFHTYFFEFLLGENVNPCCNCKILKNLFLYVLIVHDFGKNGTKFQKILQNLQLRPGVIHWSIFKLPPTFPYLRFIFILFELYIYKEFIQYWIIEL